MLVGLSAQGHRTFRLCVFLRKCYLLVNGYHLHLLKKDLLEPKLDTYLWSKNMDPSVNENNPLDHTSNEQSKGFNSSSSLNVESDDESYIEDENNINDDTTDSNRRNLDEINEEDYAEIIDKSINDDSDLNSTSNGLVSNTKTSVHRKLFKISKAEYAIRVFMSDYSSLMYGENKLKLKTLKFHHVIHIIWYISKFGSPLNVDGSRPEAVSKETGKGPGRNTQHRAESINMQAATRFYENTTISLAFSIACISHQFSNE